MQPQLNSEQLAALTQLANGVKQDYANLEITEILNRIHYITGRDFKQCIAGFKMMFSNGLIPSNFILNIETLPNLEKVLNPEFPIGQLINRLDLELKPGLDLFANEGPKDDPDEVDEPIATSATNGATVNTLFNLDSNF